MTSYACVAGPAASSDWSMIAIPPPFAGYPSTDLQRILEQERAIGGPGWEPGYTRVWSGGRDVTDEDPASWPWPWNPHKRPRRRK